MKHSISIKQVVKSRDCIGLALITLVFIAIFLAGYKYIGTLSAGHHQWLTAETMKFTENWVEDGIQNDNFLHIEDPNSIEQNGLISRGIYSSYPIGAQLPILFLKKILPNIDTLKIIHIYGYVNLYLIAILIYFLVIFSRKDFKNNIQVFAIIASISYLVLPSTRYWHSLVYFADQAVILPFALILFLELIIRKFNINLIRYFQSLILFWGMTIDYLVIPLALILYLFRLFVPLNEMGIQIAKNFIQIFSPIAFALLIQTLVLYSNDLILPLYNNFLFRSGLNNEGSNLISSFFNQFWLGGLGIFPFVIFSISIFVGTFLLIKRKYLLGNIIGIIGLLSCTLQVIILRNHSVIHDFSALKFYLPLCFLFFGYYPSIFYVYIKNKKNYSEKLNSIFKIGTSILLIFILFLWVAFEHKRFRPPIPDFSWKQLAYYLREKSRFEDVFIGFDGIEIGRWPPHTLAISRKRVYSFDKKDNIKVFLDNLPADALVTVLYVKDNSCLNSFNEIIIIPNTDIKAVRIKKDSFQFLLRCY